MTDLRHGLWTFYVPAQTVGTSLVYWDLWNGSDRDLTVSSVMAKKNAQLAVTGLVSVALYLTRTSAIGTGGTANTEEGALLTGCTINMLQQRAVPDGVTGRLTPTGGATAGAIIGRQHVYPEETVGSNYEGTEFLPSLLTVPEGTGIRILQGPTASVGSIGFDVVFY